MLQHTRQPRQPVGGYLARNPVVQDLMTCKLFQHGRITFVLTCAGAEGQAITKRQQNPVAAKWRQFCALLAAGQQANDIPKRSNQILTSAVISKLPTTD